MTTTRPVPSTACPRCFRRGWMRHTVAADDRASACFYCGHKTDEYRAVDAAYRAAMAERKAEGATERVERDRERELAAARRRIKVLPDRFTHQFLRTVEDDQLFARALVTLFREAAKS